jgi:signal transduction histidine kinase
MVERNARALAHMIEELLDVSRIAAGRMTLERRPVNLRTLVIESVEAYRQEASDRGLTLEAHAEPSLGLVVVDEARLSQVIWNLL